MPQEMLCTRCYREAKPKTHTPGSFIVELALYLLLVVPGLLYSGYRIANRHKVCRYCGSPELVDLSSPAAQEIRRRLSQQQPLLEA